MRKIISGIYGIRNKINGKIYIGQSGNIYSRWTAHRNALKNNCHHNKRLQNAWNKYGECSFDFFIVEKCGLNELDIYENFWILYYNSKNNGYNLDLGGKGIRGYIHTGDEINKMRRIQKPKIVLQFDLDFNFVKEWIGGVSHIDKEMNYTKECILLRCEHTILDKMTPYKDSYWVYKDEYESNDFSWDKYFSNVRHHDDPIICQYDLNFNLIKKWYTYYDLKNAGYDIKPVSAICKKNCTRKVYKNCVWAYEDYDFSDGYFGAINHYEPKPSREKKPVTMHKTKDGPVILSFESVTDAVIYMGQPKSHIGNIVTSIKKNQRFHGYYFKYA